MRRLYVASSEQALPITSPNTHECPCWTTWPKPPRTTVRRRRSAVGALEELRAKVRLARDEGVTFARIAKAAGISLERARQLYAGR